jgi:hypothetical protein
VFCVDEKTAIQALNRLDPVLPLSPGRIERHGFEYYRHGTLSLYAAFNTKTGLDREPEKMRLRRQTAEHPFGTIKAWMGAPHFLTKTLGRVSTEMSLHVLAPTTSSA